MIDQELQLSLDAVRKLLIRGEELVWTRCHGSGKGREGLHCAMSAQCPVHKPQAVQSC